MGGLRGFLKKNPLAGWALVILLVAVAGYVVFGQLSPTPRPTASAPVGGTTGPIRPLPSAPAPAAGPGIPTRAGVASPSIAGKTVAQAPTPPPASGAKPAPASAGTAAPPPPTGRVAVSSVVGTAPTGRPDPFSPLVLSGGGPAAAAAPPPPPLVTLPPPPLPGTIPPGGPTAVTPAGPPLPSAGLAVTGIVGDTASVAIVVVNGRTEILSEGETVGNLRVVKIDALRRLVRFSRAGTLFDVRMGGE